MSQDLQLREIYARQFLILSLSTPPFLGSTFRENPQQLHLVLFPLPLPYQTYLPTSSSPFRSHILKTPRSLVCETEFYMVP